jgi:HD-GYP domain-containing protein (c-di-GMP phosphodiesterase class II)
MTTSLDLAGATARGSAIRIDEEGLNPILENLVDAVSRHDTYTGGHSRRVSHYALQIGQVMGYPLEQLDCVRRAGLVHDIGKVVVPDQILRKKGQLTDEEFRLVRLHPSLGASILGRMPGMEDLVAAVLYHHERWDGSGYPDGLSEDEIPTEARMILVADAFDAMTTQRPYGEVLTADEAVAELSLNAGRQFDPLFVAALAAAHCDGLLAYSDPV